MAKNRNSKKVAKKLMPRQVALAKSFLGSMAITEVARRARVSKEKLARPNHRKRTTFRCNGWGLLDWRGLTPEDFDKNHLIPQLYATKKKIIRSRGKVICECRVPDNRAQLRALTTALWLHGALPSVKPKLAKRVHEGYRRMLPTAGRVRNQKSTGQNTIALDSL